MIRKSTVQLAFSQKEMSVCDICGYASSWGVQPVYCAQTPIRETPDVKVGDIVEISIPRNAHKPSADLKREKHTVTELFYSSPDTHVMPRGLGHGQPALHSLCITLAQGWGKNGNEPYQEGVHSGQFWFTITYEEFIHWRQADIPTLQALGYLPKPSFLSRLLG